MWKRISLRFSAVAAVAALAITLDGTASPAFAQGQSGTTLAGYKTIDICKVSATKWRYSGEIAVWNQGAIDTQGFDIQDFIQNKVGSGKFQNAYQVITFDPSLHEIPAGTTQLTASTFAYTFEGAPLLGDVRNVANMTILNHSGSLGKPFGPSPKATWIGDVPPCPTPPSGCTYTQGYWKNHEEVWPMTYDPDAIFYLNGSQTWLQTIKDPGNSGYNILAVQYIAAVLNKANGASVPQGVQDTIDLAKQWFTSNGPSACTGGSSCGLQKDWAAVLDKYNNGLYPGGPPHCG